MMRDNFSLIPIETELQSVENYILLQQLTSYYSVSCHIDLEERLKNMKYRPCLFWHLLRIQLSMLI